MEETAALPREIGNFIERVPEVTHYQIYAGTASPYNFNGLVRHYFLRRGPNVADIQVNLLLATVINLELELPIIENWAREVSSFGVFNFPLSDTRYLYAHRSTHLFYVARECASKSECLRSEDLTVRLAASSDRSQRVAVVATEPLTGDEEWRPLPKKTVAVFCSGERIG